ncbi:unnamed protein product, partial [Prorocentrum cordatum]
VARLHAESASAAEWRRQALLCYGEGREADFRQVLEAALQGEYEVRAMSGPERGAMLHLLAVYYVGRASSASRLDRAEREADLARAKGLLDQVEDDIDVSLGSMGGVDVFTGRGFHALATHMVSPGTGTERAEARGVSFRCRPEAGPRCAPRRARAGRHDRVGQGARAVPAGSAARLALCLEI